ncbi:UPF0223 family protein [Levilactobacillus namurensis]|uniref:UPF0223 family protein n=1 Tax=Levilactobacillus namurensis TaxID=380393 RepID=UPI002230AC84|nr:UPF0223 family protein [Levilactobacillus namurensis]MCW3778062.1 UPF0223 family protein [Levilactobacillus namurensis]MDT7018410.1 UPF0223 family protein [Levilactobacillus namurensis]WNN64604.1 UPF0223 family protein [Levilactobacillus namurensis]
MATTSNYAYPLQPDWSTDDILIVTRLYQAVEAAYEQPQGIAAQELLTAYRAFQTVVPQKFEEKQLGRAFEEVSGYSIYRTVKQARTATGSVKMKGTR